MTEIAVSDWTDTLKQALKVWHRSAELSQSPLANLHIVEKERLHKAYADDLNGRVAAMRDVLRRAIHALGVVGQSPPENEADSRWLAREWRHYAILTLRFLRGLSRTEIQHRIGLAEGGQYYTDQRQAIELVALILQDWEGAPREESSLLRLAFPSGAIPLDDTFYIERQADEELRHQIQQPGQTITITGPRQVGKTSLLIRGANQAVQALDARVAYIDLQAIGSEAMADSDTFLRLLADWLADEVGLSPAVVESSWQSALGASRKLTKLLERAILPAVGGTLVLALDEVDRLLATSFHTEFFGLLRSWHNLRAWNAEWQSFTLLMAISTEPYLLINDLQQSPFNVGLMLYLTDFSQDQVAALNERYGRPLKKAEVTELYTLLNGQPYLTRLALYTIVKQSLDFAAFSQIALTEQSPFISHLRYLRQLVESDPALRAAMKEIVTRQSCRDDLLRHRLQKAGLVQQNGTVVAPRCVLYGRYFTRHL
ncbi:AAA-like domain-containing protein [Candidatus Leptofilum sp.]|uniref:AAA-like domain-containing protein n=1 Tax=Candidatus Leptofilum sp. TaxID=3241576 RepID=UPI003B59938C